MRQKTPASGSSCIGQDCTYVEPSKETVGAYLDRWLATCAKPNVAGKTYERYEQIIEKDIKPAIGSILLSKLSPVQIAEFTVTR